MNAGIPWPSDAVMIVAANAGEECHSQMTAVVLDVNCRRCGQHLCADAAVYTLALNHPDRNGRPVLYFCIPCCVLHDPRSLPRPSPTRTDVNQQTKRQTVCQAIAKIDAEEAYLRDQLSACPEIGHALLEAADRACHGLPPDPRVLPLLAFAARITVGRIATLLVQADADANPDEEAP